MRAFTAMRRNFISQNILFTRLNAIEYHQFKIKQRLDEHDSKFEHILNTIENSGSTPKQGIFFDGQIYDAYSFAANLIRKANKRIILIDNYIDDTVLTLLDKRKDGVNATIYTSRPSKELLLDLNKHNAQYTRIDLKIFSKSHDRFLIIDEDVYLIGASIKDLGKKWFGFTLMESTLPEELLTKL